MAAWAGWGEAVTAAAVGAIHRLGDRVQAAGNEAGRKEGRPGTVRVIPDGLREATRGKGVTECDEARHSSGLLRVGHAYGFRSNFMDLQFWTTDYKAQHSSMVRYAAESELGTVMQDRQGGTDAGTR